MMTKTRFLHLREIVSQLTSLSVLVGVFYPHDWWRGRVRVYACNRESGSIDDFCIFEDGPAVHVCNAPPSAATALLAIGNSITQKISHNFS